MCIPQLLYPFICQWTLLCSVSVSPTRLNEQVHQSNAKGIKGVYFWRARVLASPTQQNAAGPRTKRYGGLYTVCPFVSATGIVGTT